MNMTLKSSFRVALNKINCSDKKSLSLCCGLPFQLVFAEETLYFHFVPMNHGFGEHSDVTRFIKLITRAEFVSLTFNSLYIDTANRKIIFRPHMLRCYSYEFDFVDDNIHRLCQELLDTSKELGYLTVHQLKLNASDYDNDDTGEYHAALDSLDLSDEA